MLSFLHWLKERSLECPSVGEPPNHSSVIASELLNQFRNAGGCPPHSDNLVFPSVSRLMSRQCPNAIRWLVVAVVVYALNAPTLFAYSHVSHKISERIQPPLTNTNSPRPITLKTFIFGLSTAFYHVVPNVVDSGLRESVLPSGYFHNFIPKTTARLCASTKKALVFNDGYASAFTTAKTAKMDCTFGRNVTVGLFQYEKSSELPSDDVYFLRHGVCYFMVERCVSGGRPATTGAHCDSGVMFEGVN